MKTNVRLMIAYKNEWDNSYEKKNPTKSSIQSYFTSLCILGLFLDADFQKKFD